MSDDQSFSIPDVSAFDAALKAAEKQSLIESLKDEQAARCAYGTREGDGKSCDCKYYTLLASNSEATGCPELRMAIIVLEEGR